MTRLCAVAVALVLFAAAVWSGCSCEEEEVAGREPPVARRTRKESKEEQPEAAAPVVPAKPDNRVDLALDDQARVTGVKVGTADLFSGAPTPFVSLCDVTRGESFVPGTPVGGEPKAGLQLEFKNLQATARVTCVQENEVLRIGCDLKGAPELAARGVLLQFVFPLDCTGWYWHDDMQTSRKIEGGEVFENVRALRAWADLPEWEDQPDLRMGYSNRNFCTVLTGPAGVCLAVPLDRPCIFRTAYDAGARQLHMIYDFALSPDTRERNQVGFSFVLYACDPVWGFRGALSRYYQLYPEMFKVHVKEPGMWMAFSRLSQIDNANEFHFGLQEGAPEPEYDDKIGVFDCTYFTHAGQFARIPDHDPEKDPLPPHDVQVEAMEATFKRRTKTDDMFHQVGLYDAEGKLDIKKARVYGHIIAQFNLDPELPYGKWHLERTATQTEEKLKKGGGVLDGFYYDGLTSGLNYRTEHFAYSAAPPLWDPAAKKPLLNNFFSASEFARAAAELLRPRGQITMMNGAIGASFFVAPWLDVLGSETGLRIKREALNYVRATTYHKPYMTLLKGNYELKVGYDEMELFMKRALAYGVLPGFFDWPPSGLGPGGRYWAHPEYYERDRVLFRTYLPLCRTLAKAGWEPITHVRSSDANVFVERFGPADDGIVWLTLLNEDDQPHATELAIDVRALGLDPATARCTDVLAGDVLELLVSDDNKVYTRLRDAAADGKYMRLRDAAAPGGVRMLHGILAFTSVVTVAADGVRMLQLCTPRQAAAWYLDQAFDALERGITMRKVDAEKRAVAVHWPYHPAGGYYGREKDADGNRVVLGGTGRKKQLFRQWAMLFQPQTAPVTLRVRAACDNPAGKGSAGIYCRAAWVSSSYTHYEKHFFKLPAGTYDYKDFEFTITSEHPLRAIYLEPQVSGMTTGKLKIASVTLADEFGDDYVVDPRFEEWYEPVPKAMRERLARESTHLRDAVSRTRKQVLAGTEKTAAGDMLTEIAGRCIRLREWIAGEKAENACRRALRDLETTEQHLGLALVGMLSVAPPRFSGPDKAAPGDEVLIKLVVPRTTGLPVRETITEGRDLVRKTRDGWVLAVPRDLPPGSKLMLRGEAWFGPEGRAVSVKASHRIDVVGPLEARLVSEGWDPETSALKLRLLVRNNRVKAARVRPELDVPPGWRVEGIRRAAVAAGGETALDLRLKPLAGAEAGLVQVTATVRTRHDAAVASTTLFYIPDRANLLRNPGFELGETGWAGFGNKAVIDRQVVRSGNASLRIRNPNRSDRSQVSQSVRLDQTEPCAVLVRAASRAEEVSGRKSREYSLYVDIYYMDGTPLYGQTYDFKTGTTDWQMGELFIEPVKPIRNVNVYLLLRGKSGTAWFDDVAVMEDPRRRGNIARDAEVTADSSYSGYSPKPVNDGIVHVKPDAHWTEESWASGDSAADHFVELRFAEARTVQRVVVYWSMDGGAARTAAEVRVQVPAGEEWRTVSAVAPPNPGPLTLIELKPAATSEAFRIVQPRGKGSSARPDLMWVREIELFPAR